MDYAKESLKMHYELRGKLEMTSRAAVDTKDALSLAYTPGVAAPCLEIQKDISKSYKNTYKNYYKDTIEQLEDMDSEDYEDLADALEISEGSAKKLVKKIISYMKSYEDVKVSKGYEVTLRFNGKMDGDEDTTEKIKVTIIKADGEWFIYNVYDMFNQANFKDDLSSVNLYTIYGSTYMNINSLY